MNEQPDLNEALAAATQQRVADASAPDAYARLDKLCVIHSPTIADSLRAMRNEEKYKQQRYIEMLAGFAPSFRSVEELLAAAKLLQDYVEGAPDSEETRAVAAFKTEAVEPGMRMYVGTKALYAKPMTRGKYNEYRGWTIPADEDPEQAGWLVQYSDGYISWSPASAFAETYHVV